MTYHDKYKSVNDLQSALQGLDEDVIKRHQKIDIELVWLFLATLGCWSVTFWLLQVLAYFITLALFAARVQTRVKEIGNFSERLALIAQDIDPLFDDEDKFRIVRRYKDIQKKLSMRSVFSSLKISSIILFYAGSLSFCLLSSH